MSFQSDNNPKGGSPGRKVHPPRRTVGETMMEPNMDVKGEFLADQDDEVVRIASEGMNSFLTDKDRQEYQSRVEWRERSRKSQHEVLQATNSSRMRK